MNWDGVNYQFWARLTIASALVCFALDRYFPNPANYELFALGAMMLLIGIAMIPRGPQPPE